MKKTILTFIVFSLLSSVSFAADFNVATTQEFRAALSSSAGNGESDTINLAAGTYKTSDDGLGTFVFLDNEDFDLTIEGVGAGATILSGDNQSRVIQFDVVGWDASVVIKKLSVSEGFMKSPSEPIGGGIYSSEKIFLVNCVLQNNEASQGGGLYVIATGMITIEDSILQNNKAGSGGAFYSDFAPVVIKGSHFISNEGSGSGGALYITGGTGGTEITDSTFTSNSSKFGGAIRLPSNGNFSVKSSVFSNNSAESYAAMGVGQRTGTVSIINSIFYGNLSESNENTGSKEIVKLKNYQYSIGGSEIINSAFVNNSGGIRYAGVNEKQSIINTVFANNTDADVSAEETTIPAIENSYLTSISGATFTTNVLSSGELGFISITDNNFGLTQTSVLIDAGKNLDTLPIFDIAGNQRIAGGGVDIGPYEFSTTRPTITKFDVEGVRKVDQVLSFVTDAAASSGRIIATYEIDNGSGTFVSASSEFSITYATSGQRSVRVKVTDDQGEWTIKTLVISIVDLTLDEKIVAATEAGRQEVINSPSTYGLALASEIPVAREEQIAACLASPSSCGINIPNADIDGNGTQDALTDGLLLLRYSFGLTGDSLISGVVAADATRKTAEEIEAYLETLMP